MITHRIHFTDHPRQLGSYVVHYGAGDKDEVLKNGRAVGEVHRILDPSGRERLLWRARLQLDSGWQVERCCLGTRITAARELVQIEQLMKAGGFLS